MSLRTEKIQARIEALTSSLPGAFESGNAGQFSLLLSMITANQSLYPGDSQPGPEFSLDLKAEKPRVEEVYTGEISERFTGALHAGERGEFAYLNSHVADAMERPPYQHRAVDHFSLVAKMLSEKSQLMATA